MYRVPRLSRHTLARCLLLGVWTIGSACRPVGDPDPIPMISELSCVILGQEDETFTASLTFRYLDADGDLDEAGSVLQWWVNENLQPPISLDLEDLAFSGTMTLGITPIQAEKDLDVRFHVLDAAGHESNELSAAVSTWDPPACAP